LGQKIGHANLLEQPGGVQTQFQEQVLFHKAVHTKLLEQTGGVQIKLSK
jgi:hypothetical protein